MADDNAPGDVHAPARRRGTKKAAPRKAAAVKKVGVARKVAPAKRTPARKVSAARTVTRARKAPSKKAPARKSVAAKKGAPAKRPSPTKRARSGAASEPSVVDDVPVEDTSVEDTGVETPRDGEGAPAEPDVAAPEVVSPWSASATIPAAASTADAPAPTRKRPRGKAILVAVLVVAVCVALAGGVYYLLTKDDDGSVGYTSLKPGQCFNNPPENFKKVSTLPCSRAHDLEVVALVTDPSPKKAPYPGTDALVRVASAQCSGAFQVYVGLPADQSQLRQVDIVPQESSWKDGNRRLVCTVRSPDGAPKTGSVKGSNR